MTLLFKDSTLMTVVVCSYLPGALKLVVADLVLQVVSEDVSDRQLFSPLMKTRQRISDVQHHSALIYDLHAEGHSADLTWGEGV